MTEVLRALLTDPAVYFLGFAGFWGLRLWISHRIRAGVDSRFAERLETYKHDLQLTLEAARFDFQRRLADASLYIQSKHTAASSVYDAARRAHGRISSLGGVSKALTFEEFNADDLRAHMRSRRVPNGKQEEILGLLGQNRGLAITELKKYLRMLDQQAAENSLIKARNTAYMNELYFSDTAIATLSHLFEVLGKFRFYAEYRPTEEHLVPTTADLDKPLEALHDTLRTEVGGSDSVPRLRPVEPHAPETELRG